jgi:phage portal protein BeeE
MECERLENGTLRYLYREPNGRQTVYSQEQIFALRFTTEDGVRPIPTYKIFQNAIGLAQALEAHGSTYFGNGARPRRPSGFASSGSGCTGAATGRFARRCCPTA